MKMYNCIFLFIFGCVFQERRYSEMNLKLIISPLLAEGIPMGRDKKRAPRIAFALSYPYGGK